MNSWENKPILSVIIPVYNTETYLRACLASVADQSLQNIEVIVVNDGSPDRSQSIINAYNSVFRNFSMRETSNKGQSAARNLGLELAHGKYVTFLDSDDQLPPDAYRALVDAAESSEAEICVGIAQSFNTARRWINPQMAELYDCVATHATFDELPLLVRDASPCNKIFSRELIEREKLRFPEGIGLREDLHLVLRAFVAARAITVIPSIVYLYRGRGDQDNLSQTEGLHPKVFKDLIWVSRDLDRLLCDRLSPGLRKQKDVVFLEYIGSRLARLLQESDSQHQQTLQEVGEFLSELPIERFDEDCLPRGYSGLLRAVRSGSKPPCLPAFEPTETRSRSMRKRLKRIQRRIEERAKGLAHLRVPTANLVAREVKLALASTGNRVTSSSRQIWIIGERRGRSAEDTGFAFFRYLRQEHTEIDAYFVLKPGAKAEQQAVMLGNVLHYGSIELTQKIMQANVLAYSDNCQDIYYGWERIRPRLRKDVVLCFLQHGVIGLHSMGNFYSKTTMSDRGEQIDLFITSSEVEKDMVTRFLGFADCEVVVTGLSRFDNLHEATPKRELLYMPSWRPWLRRSGEQNYHRSEYFLAVQAVLGDTRLHALLDEHDFHLNFLGHFAMENNTGGFHCRHPRVHLIDSGVEQVQPYLKTASLLITDYSSVSWDFAYMKRPTLFYQFDAERFYRAKGMMVMDPTVEMMGDVVRSHTDLLTTLSTWFDSEQSMTALYQARAESFFPYRDTKNSERIYQAITRRLGEKRQT